MAGIVGSAAMGGDAPLRARLFGSGFGLIAVAALQVVAFDESWGRALLFAAVLAAAAAAVAVALHRRRRGGS
jgi:hypothetical protein